MAKYKPSYAELQNDPTLTTPYQYGEILIWNNDEVRFLGRVGDKIKIGDLVMKPIATVDALQVKRR